MTKQLLHVVSSMHPAKGGVAKAIREIVPPLSLDGLKSELVCLDDPQSEYLKQSEGFPLFALGEGKTAWRYHAALYPWLLKNLRHYEVVMVHGLWQYHHYAVYRAMKKLQQQGITPLPQLYVMPHGMLDPWFQRSKTRFWKALRNRIYWQLLQEKMIRSADGLLFTCEEEMRLARTTFKPYRPQKEYVIGYGIAEPPVFQSSMQQAFQSACPALGERPYFLFMGRLDEKKGLDLLLKAYSRWRVTHPEKKILPLVIAGPGLEQDYGQKIQRMAAADPQLQEQVFFTGMLSGEAKWGALYGCEAFILPSHQENFGIVVAEALACTKPVLISDQVNIWREIEASGAGLVAPDTEGGTLHNISTWLTLSGPEKAKMQRAARQTYEQFFKVEQVAKKMLSVTSNEERGLS